MRRLCSIVLALGSAAAPAAADERPLRHVIITDPHLAALVREGHRRAGTLRRLLDEIEESGWIVFIQVGPCPNRLAASCLLHTVGTFEGKQYLRIKVQPSKHHPDAALSLIGHELQHAVEVAASGQVHDGPSMTALFDRIASADMRTASGRLFETAAARKVEWEVLRELRREVRQVSMR